ncbi:RNA-binding protein C17H9.04c [Musa troglodytarum]|uniref:RNA-binding protein C17H9.04c n=1 Tax=Musa troglodytarum TaxID=320322 RepID=A0A9E7IB11_9LILI|nr:RNA-binding protein C17H9.04c [Musa troglodytarum]URE48615.1 RNA-binding protein C17H9.04c [Musa troglodytarum]
MSRWPGDWNCRSCQHFNFSRRSSCQNCGELRSSCDFPDHGSFGSSRGESLNGLSGTSIRPGDWRCACGGHNFASRSICHTCGAFKEDSAVGCFDGDDVSNSKGGRAEWKSGDWLCTRCITCVGMQSAQLRKQEGMFPMQGAKGMRFVGMKKKNRGGRGDGRMRRMQRSSQVYYQFYFQPSHLVDAKSWLNKSFYFLLVFSTLLLLLEA